MPVTIGGSGPITGVTSINTTVSDTELGYLDGVTSALQTQLAGKADIGTNGAWTSYTPVLTASTTNPTLGSGSTATGAYTQVGKLIVYRFHFAFGSSMNAGSGTYRVSFPVNANRPGPIYGGSVLLYDSSTTNAWFASIDVAATTYFQVAYAAGGAFSTVASGVPWTWAQSDQISGTIIYEAA